MAYIPQYNFELPPLAPINTGLDKLIDEIQREREKRMQTNRYMLNTINQSMQKLELGSILQDQNNRIVSETLSGIEETVANAMMYDMDERGGFTNKRKSRSLFGPQITDSEYATILQQIQEADKMVSKMRGEEKVVLSQEALLKEEQKKPTGTVDMALTQKNFSDYWRAGIMPENNQFIVFNGINPDVWSRSSDFFLKEQGQYTESGDYHIYKDAPLDYKIGVYRSQMQDPRKQKGMAERMVDHIAAGDELGVMAETRIRAQAESLGMNINDEIIGRMIYDLNMKGKVNPLLANAAIEWGEKDAKYHLNIAKGFSVYRPGAESEKEKEPIELQKSVKTFGGVQYENFRDLSGSNYTVNLKLGNEGRKYVQKYDSKTGAVIPIEAKGEKEQAISIKNSLESKINADYKVIGWDPVKNKIILQKLYTPAEKEARVKASKSREIDQKRGYIEEEIYTIPYAGNERIINELLDKLYGAKSKNITGKEDNKIQIQWAE